MTSSPRRRAPALVTFLSALTIAALASASSASAQGTTQIASTSPAHAWWPSTHDHARAQPVALRAADDAKLAAWYIDHLGFAIAGLPGAVRGGGARTRATTIYHDGFVLRVQQAKPTGAPQHLRIAVHDLEAQLRSLERAGVPLLAHGARSVQLRDPEGNLIELVDDGSRAHSLARDH